MEEYEPDIYEYEPISDEYENEVIEKLIEFFKKNNDTVFYSKQVEIIFERKYYHWVTSRALRGLVDIELKSEIKKLDFGGAARFYWHKSNRYYKRDINKKAAIINSFSEANFVAALGQTGELLVGEGFSRFGFRTIGRDTKKLEQKEWKKSNHNLDFIFERDSVRYGVEVKNTLGYMDKKEFDIKIELCEYLEIYPLFVVRMIPSQWMYELKQKGGVFLIIEYQLYPLSHKKFASEVRDELRLKVDAPKSLKDGTLQRFMKVHEAKVRELK